LVEHFIWSSIFMVNLPVVVALIGLLPVAASPVEAQEATTGSARLHAAN
jgi:hypothetical protein